MISIYLMLSLSDAVGSIKMSNFDQVYLLLCILSSNITACSLWARHCADIIVRNKDRIPFLFDCIFWEEYSHHTGQLTPLREVMEKYRGKMYRAARGGRLIQCEWNTKAPRLNAILGVLYSLRY